MTYINATEALSTPYFREVSSREGSAIMMDFLAVAGGIAFFAACAAYAVLCENL